MYATSFLGTEANPYDRHQVSTVKYAVIFVLIFTVVRIPSTILTQGVNGVCLRPENLSELGGLSGLSVAELTDLYCIPWDPTKEIYELKIKVSSCRAQFLSLTVSFNNPAHISFIIPFPLLVANRNPCYKHFPTFSPDTCVTGKAITFIKGMVWHT